MPKLWADTLDEHRTVVRRRLVDAYVELLGEHPVEDVTVSAVASRAGVARSAVYNYVDHLHDLALLRTEETVTAWMEDLEREGEGASAAVRLDLLVRAAVETFAHDALGGLDLSSHLDDQRSERLRQILAPIMAHLGTVVADGVASGEFVDEDPTELAMFTWACIGGHRTMLGSGRLAPEATADTIIRMLRRALCVDEASGS